ncbi:MULTISPECIES: response regulator transcription factor [unclassified Paenibacillus]|uniref:response regulator n=1 Tax=unclassified Paenibacillus TaxID=185978 RepID=UPI0010513180|nr:MULTISPECIES: response regulator transcription factor [unclassified Paenibacillus]NIK70270.1 DNA-binding NarL/FixJ family response regulator [Paenibacillus sp. BK720]TCM90804.1 LuxR family two component transcriptional regulator [Paenibacillus sp. BK033]
MKIKILLADDHQIVLKGISFFLALQPDFELVGEAHNGKEAVEKAGELQPDIVLMDLNMPIMDGIEASALIKEQHPHIKVLVLTSFADQSHIVPALQTGAIGYMLKDVEPDQLAEAIRSAYKGNIQLHPDISRALLSRPEREPEQRPESVLRSLNKDKSLEALTPRELEVLELLTKGLSNKDIAQTLVVAEKTVKTHVSSILSKLDLSDRTQAALFAAPLFQNKGQMA